MLTAHRSTTAAAVVLTSVGGHRAHRYLAGYDAAKAGVESVVRSLTLEFGAHLSARAVAVGPIAESASTAADGARLPALVRLVPRARYATTDEIARAIAAFAGPDFDAAAGQTLILGGGLTVQLRPADVERPPSDQPVGCGGPKRPETPAETTGGHAGGTDHRNGAPTC